MEKLTLTLASGRYIPRPGADTDERLRAMEAYLAAMTEELEYRLAELERTVARMPTEGEE